MNGGQRQRGYVLLMTLVLLAIAASALSVLAVRSLDQVAAAQRAQEQLQEQWALLSCQRTFADRLETILQRAEEHSAQPRSHWTLEANLGGCPLRLVVTDEQAKVNLNTLYNLQGPEETRRQLRRLTPPAARNPQIRLLPQGPPTTQPVRSAPPPLGSYAQVFDTFCLEELVDAQGEERPAIAEVTCWGSGQVNYRRASAAALAQATEPQLNAYQVSQLLKLRRETPGLDLAAALRSLELSKEQIESLTQKLCDRSSCHGLWVLGRSGNRRWGRLGVYGSGSGNGVACFEW